MIKTFFLQTNAFRDFFDLLISSAKGIHAIANTCVRAPNIGFKIDSTKKTK